MNEGDTIVAVATSPAPGGVGIVRLSGTDAIAIAERLCARRLPPRRAHRIYLREADGELIDDGLALTFAAPASFTGEHVAELQLHGNPALLAEVVRLAVAAGARRAEPGEFSARAFANGRLDLAQAEGLADLISARDLASARAARRSLQGAFSSQVESLASGVLALRVQLEAAIDFADEAIEPDGGPLLTRALATLVDHTRALLERVRRGQRLRDGLQVVLAGAPNAGKSSLLNALTGVERAIVSAQPGTTRDLVHEVLQLDGATVGLVDTAGLRQSADPIEAEGIRRARAALTRADLVLALVEAGDAQAQQQRLAAELPSGADVLWVVTKCDLAPAPALEGASVCVSAHTGEGIDTLLARLTTQAGATGEDGAYSARERHVETVARALAHLEAAAAPLAHGMSELAADDLRRAHDALGEITGRVRPDDLLGAVFSSFCIGK